MSAFGNTTPDDVVVEDMFSGMKKKKSSKKVVILEEETVIPSTAEVIAANASKGNSTVDSFGNETISTPTEISTESTIENNDEFADLKKKKKKSSKKSNFDLEAFEKELQLADATAPTTADTSAATSDTEDQSNLEPVEGEDPFNNADGENDQESTMTKAEQAAHQKLWLKEGARDYHYTELLGRFYGLLYASHPSLSSSGLKKRYTLAPPSMHREGNKRSVFANVAEICKKMHRQPEHVIMFLFAELGTSGSVDGSGRLVIKGRFQQKQIENVLRRYIMEYVTCKTCKSPDTLLTKDNRLFFMACESCGSTRSVSAIKSGFQAQTGKRRAMRAAA